MLTNDLLQAHLSSTAHHTVNTNELISASATLPFHPHSLYQPAPKQKRSVSNLTTFLPPFEKAQEQIQINALFSRNYLAGTNRTRKFNISLPTQLLLRVYLDTNFLSSKPHVRRCNYASEDEREYQNRSCDIQECYGFI